MKTSMELPSGTKRYEISPPFARQKRIPSTVVARVLKETAKAAYLYGHGSIESTREGRCCVCGRKLTHPVSVTLGIGPECGGHWWDWDAIGGYNEGARAKVKELLSRVRVDGWVPKSVILSWADAEEEVTVPGDHPMLRQQAKSRGLTTERRAALITRPNGRPTIQITFPFSYEEVGRVKTLPGRKFHREGKYWTAPLSLEAVEKLERWGYRMDPAIVEWKERLSGGVEEIETTTLRLPEGLYEFQRKGIQFLHNKGGRGLIADEMGLGKTVQGLGYLYAHPEQRPAVVVCPAAVKYNWEREARRWLGEGTRIHVITGKKPYPLPTSSEILIINYDILSDHLDSLLKLRPQVVIVDECHYMKNNKARRTVAAKRLGKSAPHFIALSGTPIVNRPIEFFNALNLIEPGLFPSWWKYAQRYCGARHNGFGWDFTGATNTEELHQKLASTVMLRRKKSDVLSELPAKQRTIIPLEIDNKDEYRAAEDDFMNWLAETKGQQAAARASNAQALVRIEALKQLSVKGKMRSAIQWIRDFLDVDGKLVVFCVHRSTVDHLMREFGDLAVKVDGSTTNKQAAVDRFQRDPGCRLFVGNLRAAGVGITLTAASNVAFLELGWTPGDHDQAEDRVHRIGQQADAITAWYLIGMGTIEETIAALIDQKRRVLDQVLDGKRTEESSLLTELLRSYKDNERR